MIEAGNLFDNIDAAATDEVFTPYLATPHVRIERIVSNGHASAPGFWYDQTDGEWVILLQGSAGIEFEGEAAPRALKRGDYLHIPAHTRHRVAWTDRAGPTVWLAVHHR
jgi:cupin 2 domain-containing protein